MPRLSRNLLLIAALCCVAPAAAHSTDAEECPYSKAHGMVMLSDDAPGEVPVLESRRSYLP